MRPNKIEHIKIPVLLLQQPDKYNWKLVRESDKLTKQSKDIMWVEWDSKGAYKDKHTTIKIGTSLTMSPFNNCYTWMTTPVTEIVKDDDNYVKFKTENSNYELFKI